MSELLIRSFFRKKLAICSEKLWAISQPWGQGIVEALAESHCNVVAVFTVHVDEKYAAEHGGWAELTY